MPRYDAGGVLEGIVPHTVNRKIAFSPDSREQIRQLEQFYALDLDSSASYRLRDSHKARRKEDKRRLPPRRKARRS